MADKQSSELPVRVIEVSRKYVLALATAFITSAGLVGVAYYNSRPDDGDRFYGWQGRANTASIAYLQREVGKLHTSLDDYQQTKPVMVRRVNALEIWVEKHDAEYDKHIAEINQAERSFSLMDAQLNYKIDDCLRRIMR